MKNMQFERSTQAKSWIFNEDTLRRCRLQALSSTKSCARARKFASGFHAQCSGKEEERVVSDASATSPTSLQAAEQETLVRFHAHQIQNLVGPDAFLPELRRSDTVLSTAITMFRRFFLSNSTIQYSPRKMAVAAAFFASKLEEERVEISLLAHATSVVHQHATGSKLCRNELSQVSISDIELHESALMEGVNYEFICHHPHASIGYLIKDIIRFIQDAKTSSSEVDLLNYNQFGCSWGYDCWATEHSDSLLRRAMQIYHRASIFSDAAFLYAPGHIAFAVVAIAFQSFYEDGNLGDFMQDYLVMRYPMQTEQEILDYSRQVRSVITHLLNTPLMDLRPKHDPQEVVFQRMEELYRVLRVAEKLRSTLTIGNSMPAIKRKRSMASPEFTPPRELSQRKMAKVTPTSAYHHH